MFAVLEYAGGSTYVKGIYLSFAEAKENHEKDDRYIYFKPGEVNFSWYEADEFPIESDEEDENKEEEW